MWGEIHASPYFAINNLNRDFVNTKGFSVVFQRAGLAEVEQKFPYFKPYLDLALQPNCNAFYLNPLLLKEGSRVDPHIDRSLRSYCKTIEPPAGCQCSLCASTRGYGRGRTGIAIAQTPTWAN